MEQKIGPLVADVWHGESERFTAPLLLVHGLWDTADTWRRFTGFLAPPRLALRRALPARRRGSEPARRFEEHLSDLRAVVAALDAPPVIVGHDLGGLLALHAASAARAVGRLGTARARVGSRTTAGRPGAEREPGGSAGAADFAPLRRGRWRGAYPLQNRALEPAALLRQLTEEPLEGPLGDGRRPGPGPRGRGGPRDAARRRARPGGARRREFQVCGGSGHALPRRRELEGHGLDRSPLDHPPPRRRRSWSSTKRTRRRAETSTARSTRSPALPAHRSD